MFAARSRIAPGKVAAATTAVLTAVAAAGVLGGPAGAAPVPAGAPPEAALCTGEHWVGAFASSPTDTLGVADLTFVPQLHVADQTFRLRATPHRSGEQIRVHLTNRHRPVPITLDAVTVSLPAAPTGAAIEPDSTRPVTFRGAESVTIPAGGDVVSDPLDFSAESFRPVVVDVYVAELAALPTQHAGAGATSYYTLPGSGDHTADPRAEAFGLETTALPLLSGIDVRAPDEVSTVVAFGDSITEGFVASNVLGAPLDRAVVDTDHRYPDALQRRIDDAGLPLSVVNAGISGNRVTRDGFIPPFGPSGRARAAADVLAVQGVSDVIIAEGINDLGIPIGVPAGELIDGYIDLITRLQDAGVRVHLGTILPASNSLADGILTLPEADPVRREVNEWIREQELSDSVIDFDAALRDPDDPSILAPRFAGPDNLHPNPAGLAAMADAVDLDALGGRCRG